jgi:hypothetical protein
MCLEIYAELAVFTIVHFESGSANRARCYCCKVICTVDARVINAHIVHAVVALPTHFHDSVVITLKKSRFGVTSIVW